MFHVKHDLLLSDLINFLDNQNIHLDSKQKQQLQSYYSELKLYADKMNLISTRDKDHIIERHFLPGFYYVMYILEIYGLSTKIILDFGTGAGFPGMILAIALPDTKIVLIDSSRKKTLFLKNLSGKLDLKNVQIICDRLENLHKSIAKDVNIIVARAVASIPVLVDRCSFFLNEGCSLLTLKGENYMEEVREDLNVKIYELDPARTWTTFSQYLLNKRMIKIFQV